MWLIALTFCRCHSSAKTSEHTFLIDVANYSILRFVLLENGYFDLWWLLDNRCYYPWGLTRPRGISHTSFIVYLPNLRFKVTIAFGNFTAVGQLVRSIRLSIRFLFIRPRIRYCFFSPEGAPWNLQVAMGFVGNYAPGGLSPQMYDMPVIPINRLIASQMPLGDLLYVVETEGSYSHYAYHWVDSSIRCRQLQRLITWAEIPNFTDL